jgi:repressor LexA
MQLTDRQQAVLDFLREHRVREGVWPSLREIQGHFGFASPHAANRHLVALEKKGVIRRSGGTARSLSIVGEEDTPLVKVPVLGTIPAGYPEGREQRVDRCLSIDADSLQLPRNARTFALQVRGDSMRDAAIVEGDVVVMEFCEPRHGDIVAALIDGDVTLKRYLIKKGRPFLRAENPAYPDLIPAQELVIQGVFRALLRVDKRSRV